MPFQVEDRIEVDAPIDRCFLLATSIELVQRTIHLKPVEGKTSGLIVDGDQLLWRGWKFGIPAMHETLITAYDRPAYFQDTMGRGYFQHFQHDHHFTVENGRTVMHDQVRFTLPFGVAGRLVGQLIVVPHVVGLVKRRFALLKSLAEGDGWQQILAGAPEFERSTPR